jgi:hypothetical protein
MMDAMWGRTGCKTGYLKVLENGGMLKEGKFAGEGDGRGSQPGDCAGGESPINGADGFSDTLPRRKWLIEVGLVSCVFIKEYALSLYPDPNPCECSMEVGDREVPLELCIICRERRSGTDIGGRFESGSPP